MRAGGYAAISRGAPSPGSLGGASSSTSRLLVVMVVPRVRIARMVPCEISAAVAISRWESPSPPARPMACSYSRSASRLALGGARDLPQDVAAEFLAGAQFAGVFGVGDRGEAGAGGDCGAGGLGDARPAWSMADRSSPACAWSRSWAAVAIASSSGEERACGVRSIVMRPPVGRLGRHMMRSVQDATATSVGQLTAAPMSSPSLPRFCGSRIRRPARFAPATAAVHGAHIAAPVR